MRILIVSEGRRHAEKPEASSVGMPWGAFHCMPGLASVLADAGVRRAVALARARGGCTVEGRPQRDPDELRTVARCKRTQRRASLRFSLARCSPFWKVPARKCPLWHRRSRSRLKLRGRVLSKNRRHAMKFARRSKAHLPHCCHPAPTMILIRADGESNPRCADPCTRSSAPSCSYAT